MRDVGQYFEIIEKAIEYSPAESAEIEIERRDALRGAYDNAPHHTHIATFPHHKHVGTKILPAVEPGFSQALAEAVALIDEKTEQSQPAGNRRRRTSRKS